MKCHPNCKINLGLRVLRRRPDGYHDLETIFLPVPLCDELEVLPLPAGAALDFSQTGIPLDCPPEENICVKAYRLMAAEYPGLPPVQIKLSKRIPFGAGLGGGSSDAAAVLKALNAMFALGIGADRLRTLAARLGADCAFFIDNVPSLALGIGDQLTPLGFTPAEGLRLVLAKPPEAVSTREAYSGLRLRPYSSSTHESAAGPQVTSDPYPTLPPLTQAAAAPPDTWRNTIANDFEATVFPLHPAIADMKEAFYRSGAVYASMSGSGASVFAFFPPQADLTHLIESLGTTLLYAADCDII